MTLKMVLTPPSPPAYASPASLACPRRPGVVVRLQIARGLSKLLERDGFVSHRFLNRSSAIKSNFIVLFHFGIITVPFQVKTTDFEFRSISLVIDGFGFFFS